MRKRIWRSRKKVIMIMIIMINFRVCVSDSPSRHTDHLHRIGIPPEKAAIERSTKRTKRKVTTKKHRHDSVMTERQKKAMRMRRRKKDVERTPLHHRHH